MSCTCAADDWAEAYGCPVHVACDDQCQALADPQTVEELRAALEHWRDHGLLSGCSHGC